MSSNYSPPTYTSNTNGFREFLTSDSAVAKFAFIITLFIVFVMLMKLGIYLLVYFIGPSDNPKIINGMVSGKTYRIVPQDPKDSTSVTIPRSENKTNGIEFTWSCWIFIDDLTYNSSQYRCIFYKGSDPSDNNNGLNFPNNAPGLYIAPDKNELVVIMNTFNVINQEVRIPNIPLNKWINIIIRCKNTRLDVYVNGSVARSMNLDGVPKQNYGDVYIAPNGGFSGYLSDLRYFSRAIGTYDIQTLLISGPNTKSIDNSGKPSEKDTNFLSLRWYFGQENNPDMYN